MKKNLLLLLTLMLTTSLHSQNQKNYLEHLKIELNKQWPNNRTINLVFHGHSVPCGYFKTPKVNTLDAYPQQVLAQLKDTYPYAVINCIVTAIGGENSEQGAARFHQDVLSMNPDVLFIDYALNDRQIGLAKSEEYWVTMISKALQKGVKVVLLTPSPDLEDKDAILLKYAQQITRIANSQNVALVDSYDAFMKEKSEGTELETLMSQNNHPNRAGHQLIANHIMLLFKP